LFLETLAQPVSQPGGTPPESLFKVAHISAIRDPFLLRGVPKGRVTMSTTDREQSRILVLL
jgi:hypothetical protein